MVLTVLGPLGEEFIFRGYIFRALRNWRGVWPAAITTGVLFAASHIGWLPLAAAVPATVFGIGMCLLYHWTGRTGSVVRSGAERARLHPARDRELAVGGDHVHAPEASRRWIATGAPRST